MNLSLGTATLADAPAIAALRSDVALDLTERYGHGHWASPVTARSVTQSFKHALLLVARHDAALVGVLRLATKKPWAIDSAYFHAVKRPLYLTDMAVDPAAQRQGIGRRLLAEAIAAAREWPAQSIRLDAYDAAAGGRGFYLKCGFREVGRVTYRKTPLIYFELLL